MPKKSKEIKLIKIEAIRYSPEIEVELPQREDAERLIVRGKTLKGWEIKGDGSLDNGIELSPENSNHLHYDKESFMQLKEILALLRVHRAKIKSNCGLHIHVDVRKMTDKNILHIIKEFVACQKYIAKTFNVSKERLDSTCMFLPKTEIHKLTEKSIHNFRNNTRDNFYGYGYLDEKYYSLNASHMSKDDYQTLEFRLFGATLNFRELKERIYWTLTFIKRAIERD